MAVPPIAQLLRQESNFCCDSLDPPYSHVCEPLDKNQFHFRKSRNPFSPFNDEQGHNGFPLSPG
jgi:hypothetical protein